MTCPFLGDGSSAQVSIHKNNMSFKKYVDRSNKNTDIVKQLKGLLKELYRYIAITYEDLKLCT